MHVLSSNFCASDTTKKRHFENIQDNHQQMQGADKFWEQTTTTTTTKTAHMNICPVKLICLK
jgi:hypothetical protein